MIRNLLLLLATCALFSPMALAADPLTKATFTDYIFVTKSNFKRATRNGDSGDAHDAYMAAWAYYSGWQKR